MDPVYHPQHYLSASGQLEPIDFCRLFPFTFGKVCKYLLRAGRKDSELQDLRKALVYLQWAEQDLWQYEADLRRYAHLAHCFNNKWLNRLFQGPDFATNFRLTKEALGACIEFKGAGYGK